MNGKVNMKEARGISELPAKPAVYAMYSGIGARRYVAYVGEADNLKRRVNQHLVQRSSSITIGAAAVSLNPDLVTEVDWWEHRDFAEGVQREAAEIVAFEVLTPVLRSRAHVQKLAEQYLQDKSGFVATMRTLFASSPAGRLRRPSAQTSLERIENLEARVAELERLVAETTTLPNEPLLSSREPSKSGRRVRP